MMETVMAGRWHISEVLAQAPAQPQAPSSMAYLLPAMLVAMVVFLMLSSRSQRKREERDRHNLFARLGKNDRVLTAGGIIGTVIQVKDHEVVLKVDESTNTKVTFLKSAVQRILTDEPAAPEKKT